MQAPVLDTPYRHHTKEIPSRSHDTDYTPEIKAFVIEAVINANDGQPLSQEACHGKLQLMFGKLGGELDPKETISAVLVDMGYDPDDYLRD